MKLRYIPFTQQRYCCLPTCIQMILYKNGYKLYSQEQIGRDLYLTVPPEETYMFDKIRTWEKPKAWRWTQARKKWYTMNDFFRKKKINLKEKLYFFDSVKEAKKFLVEQIKLDNDILACFNYNKLYGEWNNWGHLSLVDSMKWEEVILIDPAENTPKIRKVKLDNLIKAMIFHWIENSWWFWLITKK